MKWFKHNTDAHTNLKTGSVIAEHGSEGYGFWWLCVELVAQQGELYRLGSEKNWKKGLVRYSSSTPEKVEELLAFFAEERLIDAEALARGDLYIPNLAEYCDDYSSRGVRTKSGSVRTLSEQSQTKSQKVPLEEKRIEENRREESKPHSRLEWLTNLPEDEVKALSEKYEATTFQVKRKGEQFANYCVSKGKTYKNYRAALENALDSDFGRRVRVALKEPEVVKPLTPEEEERIAKIKREINERVKVKSL